MTEDQILSTWKSFVARTFSLFGWSDPTPAGGPEFDTAGGEPSPGSIEAAERLVELDNPPYVEDKGNWSDGWWSIAEKSPIHEGRLGGIIAPWITVVHTTDMHPDTFDSLLRAWKKDKGRGAGAHFLLGRTPEEGLHQLGSARRNGNHAGGSRRDENGRTVPYHGWLLDAKGRRIHPNMASWGIEVSCAGTLYKIKGQWRTTNKVNGERLPFGSPIPADEVAIDSKDPNKGEHKVTAWQEYMLRRLLDALADCPYRVAPPLGWAIEANTFVPGKAWKAEVPKWAPRGAFRGDARGDIPPMPVVGHTTLDPARKADPHPPLSAYLTSALLR